MPDSRVASRYVKSLLGLAVEKSVLEDVHRDMQLFSKICESNFDLVMMLRSPIIKHDKKRAILSEIFKGKVNVLTMAILEIITRKNREPLLPLISKQFHDAYNEFKGISKAAIVTAIPLDKKLREEIESMVRKLSNRKEIELSEKVNPEIIGGFVLNVEDQQIDASMKSKLKSLEISLRQDVRAIK
jgi:F-type H+-transporting ATPase subunit delta